MDTKTKKKPPAYIILLALMIFLGVGGIGSGPVMLVDPSGELMGLPLNLLDKAPVDNYTLPGLFLLVVMGIIPLVTSYGLWKRLSWAWAAALAQGIVLVLWICYEFYLWGAPVAIQIIYLLLGLALVALCLLPSVRGMWKKE